MNIYQRVNEVRKAVKYLQKDATVQGYKAVTHDLVTARLHDSIVEHGIVIEPTLHESESIDGTTAKGGRMVVYRAKFYVSLVNIEDPKDRITVLAEAHADDYSDKAAGKALSYAVKFVLLKIFSLETGDSDESRVADERDEIERLSEAQQKVVSDLITETKASQAQFLSWIGAKSIDRIRVDQYERCVTALEKRLERKDV